MKRAPAGGGALSLGADRQDASPGAAGRAGSVDGSRPALEEEEERRGALAHHCQRIVDLVEQEQQDFHGGLAVTTGRL